MRFKNSCMEAPRLGVLFVLVAAVLMAVLPACEGWAQKTGETVPPSNAETGTLIAVVQKPDGLHVARAQVYAADGSRVWMMLSDKRGRAEFKRMRVGGYKVAVSATDNCTGARSSAGVKKGQTAWVTLNVKCTK